MPDRPGVIARKNESIALGSGHHGNISSHTDYRTDFIFLL